LISSKIHPDVRYKIIDVSNEKTVIWLQCLQTNAIFYKKIAGTTIDLDIIGKLLPEQACFFGILLGEFLRIRGDGDAHSNMTLLQNDFFLYAKEANNQCKSITFDRFGNIIFSHPKTKSICSKRAIDIVSDRVLINLFHPTIACFIGLYVGHKSSMKHTNSNVKMKGNLRLVINS
tara:strand:+ start:2400 stop:2924 length:525 start_codon:yes stop_codon:yes gene_type:complete